MSLSKGTMRRKQEADDKDTLADATLAAGATTANANNEYERKHGG